LRKQPPVFCNRVHVRFIATFKLPFKFSPEDRSHPVPGAGMKRNERPSVKTDRSREREREFVMGEFDVSAVPARAEDCFALGMMHSSGAGMPVDLVQAHKWFNIAAARGHRDAARLRREIAEQMSDSEIGQAQRAARAWLEAHPGAQAARSLVAA
jgi:uncharacterized protein